MKVTRLTALFLCLVLLAGAPPCVMAASGDDVAALLEETAAYELSSCAFTFGDEWAVIALARSGCAVPEGLFERYYADVRAAVADREGYFRKATDYAALTLALTAVGADPTDVAGYDLTATLADEERMLSVGINGASWALVALDAGGFRADDEVRQHYVDKLLSRQLAGGGFSLSGRGGADTAPDPDITAMTLLALSAYRGQPEVAAAVDRAVACLSEIQQAGGGFIGMGKLNCESCAQVVVALCDLGISPSDSRFVKNGRSVLDAMLDFRQADGGFLHLLDENDAGNANGIAAAQAFYALAAVKRAEASENALFRMGDVEARALPAEAPGGGLPGKDPAVSAVPVTKPGTTFADITGTACQMAVEALAAREIINGMTAAAFQPADTMTRSQYATIVVKALGLSPETTDAFSDVSASAWYAPYVGAAVRYGIVTGRGNGIFDPGGTINRQEAAVMTARAAALCGLDTALDAAGIRMYISEFSDYVSVDSWARGSVAFCFKAGILDGGDFAENLEPKTAILRSEVAQMIYRLLRKAELL